MLYLPTRSSSHLVWDQKHGFSPFQMSHPSSCPLPALPPGEDSPNSHIYIVGSGTQPGSRVGGDGGRGRVGTPWFALTQFCSYHLVPELDLIVVEQGGLRRTSGRLAFPVQLCGCLSCSALSKGEEQRSL